MTKELLCEFKDLRILFLLNSFFGIPVGLNFNYLNAIYCLKLILF